jgi:hypothetical protein
MVTSTEQEQMRNVTLFRIVAAGTGLMAFVGCSGATASTTTTGTTGTGGMAGSGVGTGGTGGHENPPAAEDWMRDIVSTDLQLDLTELTGKATIVLKDSKSLAASLEIGDLTIQSVENATGSLNYDIKDHPQPPKGKQLNIGLPSEGNDPTIIVKYTFNSQPNAKFDGWMANSGVTFLWPYFCGNLFPCKSDPADGLKFSVNVTGVPAGSTAVYPTNILGDAPSYQFAIAVGDFKKLDLGQTSKGTKVSWWSLNSIPGNDADLATGTAHLRDVFDFYETTYGDYTFGTEVGTVAVDWGQGPFTGMEHHPFWHVAGDYVKSTTVHAHEAAHGWFGDGVRIKCWEDFVLSEGTATYFAARSLGQFGIDLWPKYECGLKLICDDDPTNGANVVALPDTCDKIDIYTDPLRTHATYAKGAYFYKNVAAVIGVDVLDQAFSEFYKAHVGTAASMQELIDHIKTKTDANGAAAIDMLETQWLKTLACPVNVSTLCPP